MTHWSDDLLKTKGFCTRPFFHTYISQNGKALVCCNNLEHVYGNVNELSFDEVMSKNNSRVTEFRRQFINADELPDSCRLCKDDHGAIYKQQHIDRTKKLLKKFDTVEDLINNEKIYTYDVRFSNICNLQCHYCGPASSSRIAARYYNQGQHDRVLESISLNNSQQILDRFKSNINDVIEFYFAGGEPTVMKEHYDILDLCLESNRQDIVLSYNSNFTLLQNNKYNALDYWKKFRQVYINASIDAGWQQFEFIRDGGLWADVVENFKLIRQHRHIRVSVTPVIAFWNIISFPRAYIYLVENNLMNRMHRSTFGAEILDHDFLKPAVLPRKIKDRVIEIYNTEYKKYPELRPLLRYLDEDLTNLLPKTKQYVDEICQRKRCNFVDLFPELKDVFDGV